MLVDVNALSLGCHVLHFAAVRTVVIQRVLGLLLASTVVQHESEGHMSCKLWYHQVKSLL